MLFLKSTQPPQLCSEVSKAASHSTVLAVLHDQTSKMCVCVCVLICQNERYEQKPASQLFFERAYNDLKKTTNPSSTQSQYRNLKNMRPSLVLSEYYPAPCFQPPYGPQASVAFHVPLEWVVTTAVIHLD